MTNFEGYGDFCGYFGSQLNWAFFMGYLKSTTGTCVLW